MKNKLIAFISLLTLPAFAQTYSANQYLKEGMELHGKNQYDEAIELYSKIHTADPMYNIAQFEIINSMIANGKYEDALKLSTKLYDENIHEHFPTLLSIHGIALSENNKLDKALKIFDEALEINPVSTHLLFNKAIVYVKQNKKQEALDLYKKIIDIDPTHTSVLYNLGILALEDGKIVEGSLSLMTYLLFEPYSYQSKNALIALNKKYHQNYSNQSQLSYSNTGDNFKELEQILNAQVQYHNDYKLKVNIDNLAVRNMQMIIDYMENHNFSDGYYENKFGKIFQQIAKSQNTNNYLMASLLSISSDFEKEFSKNEKNILQYIESFLKKEVIEKYQYGFIENQKYKVIRQGHEKVFIPINDKNEMEGLGFVESTLGTKKATLNYKNNQLNGTKTYFYDNGNISFVEEYKEGNIDGIAQSFARNGNKIVEYYSINDIANGAYTRFKPTGGVECEGSYIENEYDGESICYFADGTVQTIVNYKKGVLHGPYKVFNEIGNIISEAQYVDGEVDGSYKEYYHDGTLKQEVTYKNSEPFSNINYHPNKEIKSSYTYDNGKIEKIEYFTLTGMLYKREYYDNKGEYSMIEDFSDNNTKYQTHYFKNGNYSHSEYNLPEISTFKTKNKNSYLSYNALGILIAEGNFSKNKPIGEWFYYNNLGILNSKLTFDNEGKYLKSEGFLNNGDKDFVVHYKNNEYYGLYEDYYNNKIRFTHYYDENGLNGPEIAYFDNGNKKHEGFYENGSLNYDTNYYTLDEKLAKKEYYLNDQLVEETYYFTNQPSHFNFFGKTGNFKLHITPHVIKEFTLKEGIFNGKYTEKAGEILLKEFTYKNGVKHGLQKYYGIHSKLDAEIEMVNDVINGVYKAYDENGMLRYVSNYMMGEENGEKTFFLPSGKIYTKFNNVEGNKHGIQYYYNENNQPVAAVEYYYGTPIAYQILDAQENLAEKKPISSEPLNIQSYYSDGKKAFEINFVNRLYDGKFVIYYANGNKALETNYNKGRKDGKEFLYYENGKKYSEKDYVGNNLHGKVLFYDINENITLKANYTEDFLHGDYEIYENNTLKHKYIYNTDFLVSK